MPNRLWTLDVGLWTTLRPFQRALAPRVVITNYQNSDEDKHLNQRELCKREIFAHKYDCPGQQKDRLDIEDQKQHRNDVITHRKAIMSARFRIDATFVGPHLVFL